MVMPCLAPILSSTLQMSCDANKCPQKERIVQCKSIFITALTREKTATWSFLEEIFNDWLSPPSQPCKAMFDNQLVLEANTELIEQYVDPEHQSMLCKGILRSQTRASMGAAYFLWRFS